MTTIQSPSHALGLMTMTMYQDIARVLPECMENPDGPGKIYPLILGLDSMLTSYRETMHHMSIGEKGQIITVRYWEKIADLNKRKKDLTFGNTSYGDKWADWFHDYLSLLSSCFQHLGLAPALENEEILDDATMEPADDNFIGKSLETEDDTTPPEN